TTLHPLPTRVEIDLPSGQLRRKTDVLSVATDRERQLIFVDDCLNRLGARIAEDARDLGRRERELREALRIGRPWDDVDALAIQLVDDRLHARALQADARAHGIDGIVAREDRDLRPASDLTRRRANLDDVLLNLRDLELEKRLHEQRIA